MYLHYISLHNFLFLQNEVELKMLDSENNVEFIEHRFEAKDEPAGNIEGIC